MQYGWYTDASGMRYFQADGTMAANTTLTVDGVLYTFDANGLATAVPVLNPAAWVTDPCDGSDDRRFHRRDCTSRNCGTGNGAGGCARQALQE